MPPGAGGDMAIGVATGVMEGAVGSRAHFLAVWPWAQPWGPILIMDTDTATPTDTRTTHIRPMPTMVVPITGVTMAAIGADLVGVTGGIITGKLPAKRRHIVTIVADASVP